MTDDELRNLQFYIGKRDGNQTDEQVIKHIDEVNASAPLTDDEWHKLLYPCCNSGCVNVLKYVLNKIKLLNHIEDFMSHTVYGRNEEIVKGRISVLKELEKRLDPNNKEKCLNETMLDAAWFGETEIVIFLIENGANINYVDANGLGILECAKRAKEEFGDDSLVNLLKEHGYAI